MNCYQIKIDLNGYCFERYVSGVLSALQCLDKIQYPLGLTLDLDRMAVVLVNMAKPDLTSTYTIGAVSIQYISAQGAMLT